jgi:hypothetical protein
VEPAEEVGGGNVPEAGKLVCERARRHATTLPSPLGVSGDVHEGVGGRRRDDLSDERGRLGGQPSPSVLLPQADEDARPLVVDDRRASPGKRKSAAGAFRAAPDRPGPRRAATLAHGRNQPNERAAARVAERGAGTRADGTALREEQLEHVAIVGN